MRPKKNFTEADLFKIEKNVKMPIARFDHATTARIRDVLKQLQVNQSFVVPYKNRQTAQYLNRKEKLGMVLKSVVITPQKKFARVFRLR